MLTPEYTPEEIERFWSKVDRSGGPNACHPWMAGRDGKGYGRAWWNGRMERAHRVAYVLAHGPLPPDKPCALHECDNPPCCNGAHLFAGTKADNNADMVAKGRAATGDRHGSRTEPERLARGERHGRHTKPERVARGERVNTAKLTEANVPHVRAALAAGQALQSIGDTYGVTKQSIWAIKVGKNWKHVP